MNLAERMAALAADTKPRQLDADGCVKHGPISKMEPHHVPKKRGRPVELRPHDTAEILDITDATKRKAARAREERERCIAVLDMETDQFDAQNNAYIAPFLVVIYSDQFEPIILWESTDHELLVARTIKALEELAGKYTIYAHNGGRFDYMFLLKRLRGVLKFKGRSLMSCRIGQHTLRDSFHIIPEKLRSWKKDDFDYDKLDRTVREKFRNEIIEYCINDCKYLLQIVRRFVKDNGLALSIGQASMKRLRKEYEVDNVGEHTDGMLRGICTDATDRENYGKRNGKSYFLGGRVECLAGADRFVGRYRLYDVNSMYPFVMANYNHPIGANYTIRHGPPGPNTAFVNVTCRNPKGALIGKDDDGSTTGNNEYGTFHTTIHEFVVARDAGLISDVVVNHVIDCNRFGNFSRFIQPIYARRLLTKSRLADLRSRNLTTTEAYDDIRLEDMLLKLYLNNAYGKFAQNPRKFRDTCIMDYGFGDEFIPEGGVEKWRQTYISECDNYVMWETRGPMWNEGKKSYDYDPLKFNNIGTGASITGAARAYLLQAILSAVDPIYCDTDSIICRDLPGVPISKTELGAWDIEKEFDEVIIVGKKQYAARFAGTNVNRKTGLPTRREDYIVRHKGVTGVSWRDMLDLLDDTKIVKKATGATITKFGTQYYLRREIKRTAPRNKSLLGNLKYGIAV